MPKGTEATILQGHCILLYITAQLTILMIQRQPRDQQQVEEGRKCVAYTDRILFSQKDQNDIICRKTEGTADHPVKCDKVHSERQILHTFPNMWHLTETTQRLKGDCCWRQGGGAE